MDFEKQISRTELTWIWGPSARKGTVRLGRRAPSPASESRSLPAASACQRGWVAMIIRVLVWSVRGLPTTRSSQLTRWASVSRGSSADGIPVVLDSTSASVLSHRYPPPPPPLSLSLPHTPLRLCVSIVSFAASSTSVLSLSLPLSPPPPPPNHPVSRRLFFSVRSLLNTMLSQRSTQAVTLSHSVP